MLNEMECKQWKIQPDSHFNISYRIEQLITKCMATCDYCFLCWLTMFKISVHVNSGFDEH